MMQDLREACNKYTLAFCVFLLIPLGAVGAEETEPFKVENQWFTFQLQIRTREQLVAFYEGRGFGPKALQEIAGHCFVTVFIRNTGNQVVWLELKHWRLYTEFDPITRTERDQWRQIWQRSGTPLAHQATFGWTLLPEQRDLLPNETVGGNITLPAMDQPFTLEAEFYLGADRKAGHTKVKVENVQCKL